MAFRTTNMDGMTEKKKVTAEDGETTVREGEAEAEEEVVTQTSEEGEDTIEGAQIVVGGANKIWHILIPDFVAIFCYWK